MSPLPEITQADLINNLTDEMAKVQQFEVDATVAENQRRVAADAQRAQDEYGAFRTKRESDAKSAYQQFVSNMQPVETVTTDTTFNQSAYDAEVAKNAAGYTAYANMLTGQGENAGDPDFLAEQQQAALAESLGMEGSKLAGFLNEAAAGVGTASAEAQAAIGYNPNFVNAGDDQFNTTSNVSTFSPPTAPAFQDWRGTSRFAGQPTFADWQTDVGQSFTNTPMLNVPNSPIPQAITQEQLIAQSRAVSPPAVQSVLRGEMPRPLQFGGLPLPTFQQLQALTPSEQEMLNSRLLTEFNVPLSDVAFQTQRQFSAPSMDRNRDLAKFRGYSV
tara:strand:- start:581 stop:1573 length:993 start_codon:yes stop_codon:yes gene_type:complete